MKDTSEYREIIDNVIRKESREEALEIILLSNKREKDDFVKYYKQEKFNYCCMLLDTIKDRLIGKGIMKESGDFGNFVKKLYN